MTHKQRPLLDYRSEFDSVRDCHYLISNSLGAMPNAAREQALAYTDIWTRRGVRSWEDEWWMLSRTVGDRIGRLIGAAPDSVSMQPNVTTAEELIISCMNFTPERNKVVMVDMEFPSMLYLYRQRLAGLAELEIIESEDGVSIPLDKLLAAIDERTALVPISHVLFRSSYIMDAAAIIKRAHKVGALVALDIFQSIGVVPVNVAELGADFAVGGALKWLCGGPGACFLYVRPDLIDQLEPRFTGWLAHKNPVAFDTGAMRYTRGSYRFQTGTPVIPALYTCQAGLEIISEIGVERIRERSNAMTRRLIDNADREGWPVTVSR
ncbi:MAG TPA: aminotransferase class V-fold PLP-dependent enzyme, partial [candidate division Zixibacteria bacterium]|nr:aminotransferase class V-fold PLP-dependent enzyme [candidate division Zixibacteria bacterium]